MDGEGLKEMTLGYLEKENLIVINFETEEQKNISIGLKPHRAVLIGDSIMKFAKKYTN